MCLINLISYHETFCSVILISWKKNVRFAMYGVVYVEQIFLFSFETCHSIWATANKRV